MNDFGLVQLIWIKRLVSETSRINTLIECRKLSESDLNRYKSVISAIDDFCAFVINSQNWRDVKNISKTVDEVEMVLFQHFYEQIDAFEDEEVSLDMSQDDEVSLRFNNPFIEDKSFGVIDDEVYRNIGKLNIEDLEESFNGPVVEGNIIPEEFEFEIANGNPFEELDFGIGNGNPHEEIEFEINDENSFLELFDMKPGESREISVVDLIKILSQNQEELSFTLNPETFPDEADILSEDEEVSFEEFIAHLISNGSKARDFEFIDDEDFFN